MRSRRRLHRSVEKTFWMPIAEEAARVEETTQIGVTRIASKSDLGNRVPECHVRDKGMCNAVATKIHKHPTMCVDSAEAIAIPGERLDQHAIA